MKKYMLINHTADIGLEVFGRTKKELFANAAWALRDILIEPRESIKVVQGRQKQITVEGSDLPDLIVNFLRELLYLFNGEALVIQKCKMMECGNRRLVARLLAEPFDKFKYSCRMEVKAVTYHGLSVEKIKTGWKARVIFDV